jgi:hypothetical protein
MSESNPYEAPVSPDDDDESEDTQSPISPDQPFAAYGGTAGFIFNIFI